MDAPSSILLVEDHLDTSNAIAALLRHRGHLVVTAADYESAVMTAKERQFDLLISDIGLPDGDGLSLLPELRSLYPIRGIIISGFGVLTNIQKAALAGYTLFLSKPCTVEAICEAVEQSRQTSAG